MVEHSSKTLASEEKRHHKYHHNHHKLECRVKKLGYCIKIEVTLKVQNVNECFSGRYILNS